MADMNKIMDFLEGLAANNHKEWFHAHKQERIEATKEFEELVQECMIEIAKFDDTILLCEPKELTFKMVRDTRFSKDKSPYNPSFRAHISAKGKLPIPVGYFINICPHDETMLGGGLFADMFKDATCMIRDHIQEHGDRFLQILEEPAFKNYFHLQGSKLKSVPKGYDPASPYAELLKYKSWYIESFVREDIVRDQAQFFSLMMVQFKAMKNFNDFLNEALVDFVMPQR